MAFPNDQLNQTATHWASDGVDSAGDFSFGSPTSRSVRWEVKSEEFYGDNGETLTSDSVVYLSVDVGVGDYLFLGTSVVSNPKSVTGAKEVKGFAKIPSVDGAKFQRKAFLA